MAASTHAIVRGLVGIPGPELSLAACCCRRPSNDARIASTRQAAGVAIDWQKFRTTVAAHRIWGLAADGLAAAGIDPPAFVAGELKARAAAVARENLALAAEALRLQRLFDDQQIPVLFLKGVALAVLAYGTLSLKHGMDIDLLVPADTLGAARNVLEGAGYDLRRPPPGLSTAQMRAILRYGADLTFVHADRGYIVELHLRLSKNPFLLRAAGAIHGQAVALSAAASICTLQDDDLFAYLCVHGAEHGWSRLKWLADLAAWLNQRPGEIEEFYRSACAAGAGPCAGLALLLCARLLAVDVPAALLDELRKSARLDFLETVALRTMHAGRADAVDEAPLVTTLVSFSLLFLSGRPRYLLFEVRRLLFRLEDVVAVPLPVWLHFLYPVLRLPLWAWRQARAARTTSA